MKTPKPLSGLRVVELAGIGPGPYCGQLFADLGAEVIVVHRPGPDAPAVDQRGKSSIVIDLRQPGADEVILKLVETADVLIEGNRPGVAERLGVGPEDCRKRNPRLVYGRMTGWGQTGPWAHRAGHDINYLSITGALNAIGAKDGAPPPPLNLIGDYGGGSLFLAFGVLAAVLKARQTGQGDVVDSAIIDGVSSMLGIVHSLAGLNQWSPARQDNLLDGGAPFYRCYRTKDGGFIAVGAIEPQFFARMLDGLALDPAVYGAQNDKVQWPRQHRLIEAAFLKKTRAEWSEIFDGVDACVTPVLDHIEALSHPHNLARASHALSDGLVHPHPAPRFASGADGYRPRAIAAKGADSSRVLAEAGFSNAEIDALRRRDVIGAEEIIGVKPEMSRGD